MKIVGQTHLINKKKFRNFKKSATKTLIFNDSKQFL